MTTDVTEKLEQEFVSLVEKSWKTYNNFYWNNSVDEILIGAVINASLEKGYLLIDLKSERPYAYSYTASQTEADPTGGGFKKPVNDHFLRFENPTDHSRLIYQVDRLTNELSETRVLGYLARITIGYGQKAKDFGQVLQVVKQQLKTAFVDKSEPGIISFDAEELAGYIYAKVSILINLSEYTKDNQITNIDYEKLNYHIEATIHSLRKYLKNINFI